MPLFLITLAFLAALLAAFMLSEWMVARRRRRKKLDPVFSEQSFRKPVEDHRAHSRRRSKARPSDLGGSPKSS